MARLALGSAAKSKMANTRVTEAEAQMLVEEFGSLPNALRTLINRWKREKRNESAGSAEAVRRRG